MLFRSRIVLEMKRSFPGTVALRGNHEEMFLGYLGMEGAHGSAFLSNGGVPTMRSFGLQGPLGRNEPGAEEAVQEELAFLRDALVSRFAEGGAIFVHAGIRPGVPLAEQSPEDLFWIREEFLDADPGLPWLVVFGHTPYRNGPQIGRAHI